MGDSDRLPAGSASRFRRVKPRLMKHDDRQLSFTFPLRQLRFAFKSVTEFPLSRKRYGSKEKIEKCWSLLTGNLELLKLWTGGPIISSEKDSGFIYFYYSGGELRYIGRTRQENFFLRLSQKFDNGIIGYPDNIKRLLLNAAYSGMLRIQTYEVETNLLNNEEIKLIQKHAPYNKLWNQEHNPYFKKANLYI